MGLEQSPDFLLSKHSHMLESGNESTLRVLYYPPLGAPAPGLARCGAHCDYGTITLLAQVRLKLFKSYILVYYIIIIVGRIAKVAWKYKLHTANDGEELDIFQVLFW